MAEMEGDLLSPSEQERAGRAQSTSLLCVYSISNALWLWRMAYDRQTEGSADELRQETAQEKSMGSRCWIMWGVKRWQIEVELSHWRW